MCFFVNDNKFKTEYFTFFQNCDIIEAGEIYMLVLDVNNLSKSFGYGFLFEGLSFSLNEGERISIVGPNGCGKSTLLKIIAKIENADCGSVGIKKGAKVAYLDQTAPDCKDERRVYDVIKDAFDDLNKIQKEIDLILLKMQEETLEEENARLAKRYSVLFDEFESMGGYEIDSNIQTVCNGLQIQQDMLMQEYSTLSGGEKTLVHLAKALLQKPALFLLDEPTNHLDIKRIEWLENYVKTFKGAIVTVSHDRYFLDKISNKILEIDNGEAIIYNTNYSGYIQEKQKNFEKQMTDFKMQQAYFKRMEEQIAYFAQIGMARNSSTMTKRASSLQSKLDRERAKAVKRPQEQKDIKMNFEEKNKTSKRILETKNLTVKTPEKNIIENVNVNIRMGEKIAILGDNGSGKSTFIKTILNQQPLEVEGEVFVGPSVKIGYLPQIINFEDNNQSLLEYFSEETCLNEQKARQTLSRFLFDKDDVGKRVGNLSGGERIRVRLGILLQQKVNTLIFDEPTNHIDIPTKETLEEAIESFDGTTIFISHDRYFINKFANRILEFKDRGVKNYVGDYEYFKNCNKK